jgi:hypothetical protein
MEQVKTASIMIGGYTPMSLTLSVNWGRPTLQAHVIWMVGAADSNDF